LFPKYDTIRLSKRKRYKQVESLQKMTVEESVLYDEIIDREIATSEELEFARKLLYGS
jgi:hypothetical protein